MPVDVAVRAVLLATIGFGFVALISFRGLCLLLAPASISACFGEECCRIGAGSANSALLIFDDLRFYVARDEGGRVGEYGLERVEAGWESIYDGDRGDFIVEGLFELIDLADVGEQIVDLRLKRFSVRKGSVENLIDESNKALLALALVTLAQPVPGFL